MRAERPAFFVPGNAGPEVSLFAGAPRLYPVSKREKTQTRQILNETPQTFRRYQHDCNCYCSEHDRVN